MNTNHMILIAILLTGGFIVVTLLRYQGTIWHSTFRTHNSNFSSLFSSPYEESTINTVSRLDLHKSPYFNISLYRKGEGKLALDDYAIYHAMVLNGTLPKRFLIMDTHTGVGFGNRLEQAQWAALFAILSSRAFVSSWTSPFPLSNIIREDDVNINWFSVDTKALRAQLKNTTLFFSDSDGFKPHVENGSLIRNLEGHEAVDIGNFRGIVIPGQELYSNPIYRDLIPELWPVWKTHILRYLIKSPVAAIQERVNKIKDQIVGHGFEQLITMQIRTVHFGHNEGRQNRIIDCAKHFASTNLLGEESRYKKTAYYVSADTMDSRDLARVVLGNTSVFDSGSAPVHVGEIGEGKDKLEEIFGTIADWWMIGEGNFKIISERSTFGGMASDRTFSKRYSVGGLTQCTKPNAPGYLELIYQGLDVTYAQLGTMKFVLEQK